MPETSIILKFKVGSPSSIPFMGVKGRLASATPRLGGSTFFVKVTL